MREGGGGSVSETNRQLMREDRHDDASQSTSSYFACLIR